MSEFEREIPSYRLAKTHRGDDLQAVAHRELGNANRWVELVWLNRLSHPYLTDDENQVTTSVILTGSLIKVPAPKGVYTDDADQGRAYGRDVRIANGLLGADETGDVAIAAGVENLTQQLKHAIDTPRGQLRRHPGYGCLVHSLKGTVTGPLASAIGAQHVRATLKADYRVSAVKSSVAVAVGDSTRFTAKVEAIAGDSVDIVAGA